ncbi:hypothetical protein U1Q18_007354 [Sarracenia purpurea var. burkii]
MDGKRSTDMVQFGCLERPSEYPFYSSFPTNSAKQNRATPPPPPGTTALVSSSEPPPGPSGKRSSNGSGETPTGEISKGFGDFQMKLKPVHWDKVIANDDHSMVWDKINDGSFR